MSDCTRFYARVLAPARIPSQREWSLSHIHVGHGHQDWIGRLIKHLVVYTWGVINAERAIISKATKVNGQVWGVSGGGVQSVRDTCDQFNLDIITRH